MGSLPFSFWHNDKDTQADSEEENEAWSSAIKLHDAMNTTTQLVLTRYDSCYLEKLGLFVNLRINNVESH